MVIDTSNLIYTSSNLYEPIYPIEDLLANNTYTFYVIPFYTNSPEYYQFAQVNTLAVIGSLDITDIRSDSVLLKWDRLAYAYNYITITWTNVNLINFYNSQALNFNNIYVTGEINNLTATSNLISGLAPNTPYFFTITAYNSINVPTPPIITNTIYTLSTISPITSGINNTRLSSISLNWKKENYKFVKLFWTPTLLEGSSGSFLTTSDLENVATNPILNPMFSSSNIYDSSYTVTNLNSNVTYNFALFAFNSNNFINSNCSTFQWTTTPIVGGVYISNITNNSARVNWSYGNYYSIMVRVFKNNILEREIPLIRAEYIDIYNLLPNVRYRFGVIPFTKQMTSNVTIIRGVTVYSQFIVTLSTLGALSLSQITNKSVLVSWNRGEYNYLNLYYLSFTFNGSSSNIYNIPYNQSNITIDRLYGNQNYYIQITPFNLDNINSVNSNISFYTLPNIPYLRIVDDIYAITYNSIHLEWGTDNIFQSYSFVDIFWNSGSLLKLTSSDVIINNLNINQLYNFILIPYNNILSAGSNLYLDVATYGTITNLSSSNISINSIDFKWANSNSGLDIYYSDNIINNYTSSNISIQNLTANTLYNFQFFSSNVTDSITTDPVRINLKTLPIVNAISINNIRKNSINVNWDDNSYYEYIKISHIELVTRNITDIFVPYNNTFSYTVPDLSPNTAYTFRITPYNNAIVNSNLNLPDTFGRTISNNIFLYTLSDIISASVTNYTTNTISLSWTYLPDSFDSITLNWVNLITGGSNVIEDIRNKDSFDIIGSSIFPNQLYNILVISKNISLTLGTSVYALNGSSSNIITKPSAGTILINSITTTSLNVRWASKNFFEYVDIQLYDINNNLIDSITNYYQNSYQFNDLISNLYYIIDIIPYNFAIPSEVGITSTIQLNTIATVGALSLVDMTDTSINIGWGTGSYSSVTIEWKNYNSSNVIYSALGVSSCNITDLVSNRLYNITVYPNNSNFLPGNLPSGSPVFFNVVTHATIGSAFINNISAFNANLIWFGGTYSAISIQWTDLYNNNIINPNPNLSTYNITNLYPNTTNIFRIVPYNSASVLSYNNSLYTDPIITLGYITNPGISNIRDSSVNIKLSDVGYSEFSNYDINLFNANNSFISKISRQYDMNAIINTGILPNINYYITLLPYNSVNIPNNSYNTILPFTSLATLGNLGPVSLTTSSISFTWDKANSTYSIINWSPPNNNNISQSEIVNGNSYSITNLGSNTEYNINIIPYNTVNNSNIYNYINLNKYTLPIITSASSFIVNNQRINMTWSGYYDNVEVTITNTRNPTVATYIFTDNTFEYFPLNPDTGYTIQLKPFNIQGASGSIVTLVNYTLPFIYTFVIDNYTDTTVKLNWANNANVSSGGIGISWTPPDSFTRELIFRTVDNYLVTGLKANTNYTFSAKSSNSASPPETGNTLTTSVITLPNIINVNAYLDDDFATHTILGGYSNILIAWSNLSVIDSPTYSNYFINDNINNIYTTENIIANSLYKFTYTPYNDDNIVGNIYNIARIAALATVGPVRAYEYTTNLIKLTWINEGYRYNYVYNKYNGVYSPAIYGNSNILNNLIPNTSYYIDVIPVNSFNIENINDASKTRVCTLPLVNSVTSESILAYSLDLNINSYSHYADISYIASGTPRSLTIYGQFMNSNVIVPITDLSANTTYDFAITPYNTSNEVGEIYTLNNVLTKSIINNITISNIATNQFTIDWFSTGTYKSLDVIWRSLIPGGLTGNDRLTDLVKPQVLGPANNNIFYPNTLYSIQVIPSVDLTIGINSPLCNVCTLPIIGSTLNVSTILDTSAFISWSNPIITAQFSSWTNTGYNYVNVYWTSNLTDIISYSNLYENNYTISNLLPNQNYKSYVFPYNLSNLNGTAIINNFTTLSTIDVNLTYITMTYDSGSSYTSTATLYWAGVYDYIRYYYSWTDYNGVAQSINRVLINSALSPNSAVIASGLLPNINYTFVIEPYSSIGTLGVFRTIRKFTLPYLLSAFVGASNDTTATLQWSTAGLYDRYSNIYITSVPDTGTSIAQIPPFTQRNLIANTSYVFTLTPYNTDGLAGIGIVLPSIMTYASLIETSVIPNISSFDNITFSGTYNYVIIKYSTNYTSEIYNGSIPSTITGLLSNTQYTVVFIPYNSAGRSPDSTFLQSSPYTVITSTLASVTLLPFEATINTITVKWSKASNNYNYLIITWFQVSGNIIDFTTLSSGQIPYSLNDSGSYTITNLISYTTYRITVTAFNSLNISYQITPVDATTLVYISDVLPMEVTINSVKIKWIGEYHHVAVYSSYNTTPIILNTGVTNYSFDNTNGNIFSSNTSYTFFVVPYDNNIPATAGATKSVIIKTLPQLSTSTSVTNVGSVSATVSWSGNFANVNVDAIAVSGVETITSTVNVATNSYQFTTLLPNTYYKFTITPFSSAVAYNDGSVFNQGAPVTTSPNILTLGLISGLRIDQTTTTNISLSWDAGKFTTVNLQLATGGNTIQFINNFIGNVYDFSNYLAANTLYTIRLFATNSLGIVNNSQPAAENIIVGNTLPVVTSFTISQVTSNSITVAWTGNVTKANLLWIGTDGTQGSIIGYTGYSYNTYTTSSLSINITYTFTLTPFNYNNASGAVRTLQATTLATLGDITVGTSSINSVDMSWSSGTYSYIVFSWTGSSTGRSINVLSSPYTVLGLVINGTYNIVGIPYNRDGAAGTGVLVSSTVYTLPLIDSFNIINITNNDMTLTWGGSYSRLDITWTGTAGPTSGTLNNVTGSTYNFGGYLTPGATYTFTLTPYNSVNIQNPYTPSDPGVLSGTTLP